MASYSTAFVRCSVIMPALADTSGPRWGVLAPAPLVLRSKIVTRIRTRTTTTKRRLIKTKIRIRIRIRMITAAILAGTIPTTLDAGEKTHRLPIHKRSAA